MILIRGSIICYFCIEPEYYILQYFWFPLNKQLNQKKIFKYRDLLMLVGILPK